MRTEVKRVILEDPGISVVTFDTLKNIENLFITWVFYPDYNAQQHIFSILEKSDNQPFLVIGYSASPSFFHFNSLLLEKIIYKNSAQLPSININVVHPDNRNLVVFIADGFEI